MLPVKETQAVCVWGGGEGGWIPVKSDCKAENPDFGGATTSLIRFLLLANGGSAVSLFLQAP